MYLLADQTFAGGDLVQQTAANVASTAKGFDDLWNKILSGPLYSSLCSIGALFAVATLTFFIIEWTKKMINGDEQRAITDLIWVLIVVVLLSNNGKILGEGTLAIRNYINNANTAILTQTAEGLDLRAGFQKAIGVEAARNAIGLAIQKCQTSSVQPAQAIECLQQAKTDLSQKYPEYFDQNNGPLKWLIDRVDRIIQAPIDAIQQGENPLQILFSPFSAIIGSNVVSLITIVLLGFNGAYQWAIELTMLVTAFLGPLAVGGRANALKYVKNSLDKNMYMWV